MSLKIRRNVISILRLVETRLWLPSIGHPLRNLSTTPRLSTQLPPRPKIREEDITENFIKGGGAGGQKINKTNSLVQLLHHPTSLTVKCQATRSRSQNRTIARRVLAERIEELEKGDDSRTRIKDLKKITKKRNSTRKKRRKYRKLEGNENASEEDTIEDGEATESDSPQPHKGLTEPIPHDHDKSQPSG